MAGLNRSGPRTAHRPVARISVYVRAGKAMAHQVTDDELTPMDAENVSDSKSDLTYYLDWENGEQQKEVRLVE